MYIKKGSSRLKNIEKYNYRIFRKIFMEYRKFAQNSLSESCN